ncbi:MAG: DUF402 domain-containing protein [Pyrinomonadaceae bacterium]
MAQQPSKPITVRVLKYDGTEYRRWSAHISQLTDSLIVLHAEFETDVEHELLGAIARGTRTEEYYWLRRWYNVFRFLNSDGTTRLFYCNISMPPLLKDNELTYVDLDIDVLVQPDSNCQVLDLEEFEANAERYCYSEEVKARVAQALDELRNTIESQQFPFAQR